MTVARTNGMAVMQIRLPGVGVSGTLPTLVGLLTGLVALDLNAALEE